MAECLWDWNLHRGKFIYFSYPKSLTPFCKLLLSALGKWLCSGVWLAKRELESHWVKDRDFKGVATLILVEYNVKRSNLVYVTVVFWLFTTDSLPSEDLDPGRLIMMLECGHLQSLKPVYASTGTSGGSQGLAACKLKYCPWQVRYHCINHWHNFKSLEYQYFI